MLFILASECSRGDARRDGKGCGHTSPWAFHPMGDDAQAGSLTLTTHELLRVSYIPLSFCAYSLCIGAVDRGLTS